MTSPLLGPIGLALRLVGLGALLAGANLAHAGEHCGRANADGVVTCEVGIDHGRVEQIATVQESPVWCWAASISMIFSYYGYKLAQSQIVAASAPIVPSGPSAASGELISWLLSKAWTAQGNQTFESTAFAADAHSGRLELTNEEVIAELSEEHPLLVGIRGHAMVLVALHFQRSARGTVRIDGATVVDPAPGAGIRKLSPSEMRPTYVAAVRIRSETQPTLVAVSNRAAVQ